MERTIEALETDILDLGAVSVETQGSPPGVGEPEGHFGIAGICDD